MAQLGELARLIDDQQLHAAVSEVFGLSALREAFTAQKARRRPGKVIIEVGAAARR
jgi:NADPH:quinone reductase-like Zn-dependent oxidoreductase